MIFKVQWGQKSPKRGKMCLIKVVSGPRKGATGSLPGYRTWYAAPTCSTLARTLCGTLARTRAHFGQTHLSTFWRFLTPLNLKNHTKHPPWCDKTSEMHSYISQMFPLNAHILLLLYDLPCVLCIKLKHSVYILYLTRGPCHGMIVDGGYMFLLDPDMASFPCVTWRCPKYR